MSQVAEETILLCPQAQCKRCEMPGGVDPAKTNIENYRCPQCAGKFCNVCFKANYDDRTGHTFFCPHCGQLLKFS